MGKWLILKHQGQKGLETNLRNSSLYTGETEAIEWEGLAHSYALGGEQGRPRTQVPLHCLQTGRRQAEGPGPGMPGCGRVRAQLAPSLSPGPLTPLRAPLHPQAPWRSGRSSPSTLAATSAQPATRQAWPTNTWPSLCKVGPPALLARQPRPVGQGAGAELEAGGAGDGGENRGPRPASGLALRRGPTGLFRAQVSGTPVSFGDFSLRGPLGRGAWV